MTGALRQELERAGIEPEYVALVDPDTFEPLASLSTGGLLVLAARVGRVRLIDNTVLSVTAHAAAPEPPTTTGKVIETCNV